MITNVGEFSLIALQKMADELENLNAHMEHLVEAVYDVAEAIRQSKLEVTEERDINVLHDVNVLGHPKP